MEDETCNLYSELTWAQVKIGDPITMEGKDIFGDYQWSLPHSIVSCILWCERFLPGNAKDYL